MECHLRLLGQDMLSDVLPKHVELRVIYLLRDGVLEHQLPTLYLVEERQYHQRLFTYIIASMTLFEYRGRRKQWSDPMALPLPAPTLCVPATTATGDSQSISHLASNSSSAIWTLTQAPGMG